MIRRICRGGALMVLVAALLPVLLVGSRPAAAASAPSGPPALGVSLDFATDSVSGFATRLGRPAAVYTQSTGFPLTAAERTYLDQFFAQVSAVGGEALLTVTPRGPLSSLGPAEAADLAGTLQQLPDRYGTPTILRFAPEANAPWQPWGLQPQAYVRGFSAVAAAVHALQPAGGVPPMRMLWSPAYGRGYPFAGAGPQPQPGYAAFGALDTSADGVLDARDDPYGPFYPGDDAVDLVGLPVYHWGSTFPYGANEVPAPDEFSALLAGRGPGGSAGTPAQRDFYRRFGAEHRKPLVVETAALYNPSSGGPTELEIKLAWWAQVFGSETRRNLPGLAVVDLLEQQRAEPAASNADIDWRNTTTPELASALRAELTRAGVQLAPVVGSRQADLPLPPAAGPVLRGGLGWSVVGVAAVVYLALILLPLTGRLPKRWGYRDDDGSRDLRVDWLRGLAIVFVVLDHVNLTSLFQILSQEAIGPVSGAELFVALSGMVVGLVYRPRLERLGLLSTTPLLWRRAARLYATALVVVLAAYAASRIPGLDGRVIRTFTQATGTGAGGTTYDLYADIGQFLDYPVPGFVIRSLLLLQMGPSQFNIIGLYIVLMLVAAGLLWLLRRQLALLVLGLSWAVYALNTVHPVRLLPSQFEDAFPLLTWQVLFVTGLVVGYHRTTILGWATSPGGRLVVAALAALHGVFLFVTWNNPYQSNTFDVRLGLIPASTFNRLYGNLFQRQTLQIGRLLDVVLLLVTLFALLTCYWQPLRRAVGWLLVPLGNASLYVFVLQVFATLVVASIPALRHGNVWSGTLAQAVVLAVLWFLVRRKVLFGLIPR